MTTLALKKLIEQAFEDAETISDFKKRVFDIIDLEAEERIEEIKAKNRRRAENWKKEYDPSEDDE